VIVLQSGSNGTTTVPEGISSNWAVDKISWDDCLEFNRKTHLKLPTEAQGVRLPTGGPMRRLAVVVIWTPWAGI